MGASGGLSLPPELVAGRKERRAKEVARGRGGDAGVSKRGETSGTTNYGGVQVQSMSAVGVGGGVRV